MRFLLFILLILLPFVACNSGSVTNMEHEKDSEKVGVQLAGQEDSVIFHKLELARDGNIINVKLKRGTQKTIIEFPPAGTETNLTIHKNGVLISKLDYYFDDSSSLNQFVIITDSTNLNKEEVYNANYLSCNQSGSYVILIN